jgi:hypothetical protein
MNKKLFQIIGVIVALLFIAGVVYLSLSRTDGLLVYTLDDPYIHLAVAENLLAGHSYGINPGENASPSSSILYPFLLLPLLAIGAGHLAPLILATLGTLGASWILAHLVWRTYGCDTASGLRLEPLIVLSALILLCNLVGLPLTGMEHTLHVWASLAVVLGLALFDADKPTPWPLMLGIVFCPLLRFEGMAFAVFGLIALVLLGRWRVSALLATLVVAVMASHFIYMASLGLPVLPSSVMTKHATSAAVSGASGANPMASLITDFVVASQKAEAQKLYIGLALLLLAALRRNGSDRILIFVVSGGVLAHLLAGQYGWFSRYEIYIVTAMVGAILYLYRDVFSKQLQNARLRVFAVLFGLIGIGAPYVVTTAFSPGASENVYAQQYQLHRFSTEYFPKPFAANDIGYLAYDNPAYILDLWGLGSEEARQMSADGVRSPEEVSALVSDKQIDYAMVYDSWFEVGLPGDWCHIARLTTPQVSSAQPQVSFYLINPTLQGEMRDALAAFGQSLPAVASLDVNPAC